MCRCVTTFACFTYSLTYLGELVRQAQLVEEGVDLALGRYGEVWGDRGESRGSMLAGRGYRAGTGEIWGRDR